MSVLSESAYLFETDEESVCDEPVAQDVPPAPAPPPPRLAKRRKVDKPTPTPKPQPKQKPKPKAPNKKLQKLHTQAKANAMVLFPKPKALKKHAYKAVDVPVPSASASGPGGNTKKHQHQAVLGGDTIKLVSLGEAEEEALLHDQSASLSTQTKAIIDARRKKAAKHVAPKLHDTMIDPVALTASVPGVPPSKTLSVYPIQAMIKCFPHMSAQGKCVTPAFGPQGSSSSSSSSSNSMPMPSADEHVTDPVRAELKAHVDNLARPVMRVRGGAITGPELTSMLRDTRISLPIQSSQLEDWLLQEAGTFAAPGTAHRVTYPPCMMAEKCVASNWRLPGGPQNGFRLTGFMYAGEAELFRKSHGQVAPHEARPCVLCCRAHASSFIMRLRAQLHRVTDRPSQEGSLTVDPSTVCQYYRNTVDQPGGYVRSAVLVAERDRWEGLVSPVVRLDLLRLRAVRDTSQGGRWRVVQDAIKWRQRAPVPPPKLGEVVRDFRKRAAQWMARRRRGASLAEQAQQALWMEDRCADPSVSEEVRALPSLLEVLRANDFAIEGSGNPKPNPNLLGEIQRGALLKDCETHVGPWRTRNWLSWRARCEELERLRAPGCIPNIYEELDLRLLWSVTSHLCAIDDLRRCCWWFDIRGVDDFLLRTMSKAVPQPCQTRSYDELVRLIFDLPTKCKGGSSSTRRRQRQNQRSASRKRKLRRLDSGEGESESEAEGESDNEVVARGFKRKFSSEASDNTSRTQEDHDNDAEEEENDEAEETEPESKLKEDDMTNCFRSWMSVCVLGMLPSTYPGCRPSLLRTVAFLRYIKRKGMGPLSEALALPPRFCQFAVREYMCHVIMCSPMTQKALSCLFKIESFAHIVYVAMNQVRSVMRWHRYEELEGALLKRAAAKAPGLSGGDLEWVAVNALETEDEDRLAGALLESLNHADVDKILRKAHAHNLAISYQRMRAPMDRVLHTCNRGRNGRFAPVSTEWLQQQQQNSPEGEGEQAIGLPRAKLRLLERWMYYVDPQKQTLANTVWRYLDQLGAPKVAVDTLNDICYSYNHERMGKRRLRDTLATFAHQYPQTLYLAQTVCFMWQHRQRVRQYKLPLHYAENQVLALCERFGLAGPEKHSSVKEVTDACPLHRALLHHCSVCSNIYSLFRKARETLSPTTLLEHAKDHAKHQDKEREAGRSLPLKDVYGFGNVRRDFRTNLLYCNSNRANGYMRCSEQPLDAYPLAGNVVQLGKRRCVILCPQEGCGLAMQVDGTIQRYTERGISCSRCTRLFDAGQLEELLGNHGVGMTTKLKCTMCKDGSGCASSRAYCYTQGVFLCTQHHSPELLARVEALGAGADRDSIVKLVVDYHAKLAAAKKARQLSSIRYQVTRSRALTHAKRGPARYTYQ